MSGFSVDANGLASASAGYALAADHQMDVHSTLVDQLNSAGECWGDDEAGQYFASNYVGPAIKCLQQMNDACGGLTSMKHAIGTWAQNYVNSDDAAKQDCTTQLRS